MSQPLDTATGLPAGGVVRGATVEVVVGWLITHPDGYEARLGPDETRARLYAAKQHGRIEPIYVRRPAGIAAGAALGEAARAG